MPHSGLRGLFSTHAQLALPASAAACAQTHSPLNQKTVDVFRPAMLRHFLDGSFPGAKLHLCSGPLTLGVAFKTSTKLARPSAACHW